MAREIERLDGDYTAIRLNAGKYEPYAAIRAKQMSIEEIQVMFPGARFVTPLDNPGEYEMWIGEEVGE